MARYTKFAFPISSYQPQALQEGFSEKELRREYSRLRSVARKRLERFAGTEWQDTSVYLYNAGRYKPVAQVKGKAELAHLLSDVARFLTSAGGSVSGQKEIRDKTIATWHEKGYTWLNEKNYKAFVRFLDFAKDFVGAPYLEQTLDMFRAAEDQGVDPEIVKRNFKWYWENFDQESKTLPEMPKFKKVVYKGGKRNR